MVSSIRTPPKLVIENPASVVKELVENSLDAGAMEITIEIKIGGRQLIRISDNGMGMNPDDALLCLERHATSKIRQVEDIEETSSLGFRGEAIPSIASISKFTLITRQENSNEGTMVIVEAGRIIKSCPVERTTGTTIEVKSLFFNIPVRKKFQRSPSYDQGEIFKTVTLAALGNPQVRFELIADQKLLLTCPGGQNIQKRIATVMGKDFAANTIPISGQDDKFGLTGVIGLPSFHRPNRTGQHLFINQRPIWSPLISSSVREGYSTTLPENRYPTFVLHLDLPGTLVDVNVHPRKKEVRLRLEQELREFILRTVSEAVQKVAQQTERSFHLPQPTTMPPPPQHRFPIQRQSWNTASIPIKERTAPPQPLTPFLPSLESEPVVLTTIKGYILVDPKTLPNAREDQILALIDQREAHARILFDQLQTEPVHEAQMLLIPLSLELSNVEATLLREHLLHFTKLGVIIREGSDNTFVVEAFPQFLKTRDIKALIHEMLSDLNEQETTHIPGREQEKHLATAIAKAALPRSQKLTLEEAQALLKQLMQCKSPLMGLFGQPTITILEKNEMIDLFSRSTSHALL